MDGRRRGSGWMVPPTNTPSGPRTQGQDRIATAPRVLRIAVEFTAAKRAVALGWFDKAYILLERGYNVDLPGLAFSVEIRRTNKASENFRWQLKVHEWLKARGIEPQGGNVETLAAARAEGVLVPDPAPAE